MAEFRQQAEWARTCELLALIRSGRWKLWLDADAEQLPPVLYDLEDDPGETHDLSASAEHAPVRERLLVRLLEGWDPAEVSRASGELTADREVLRAWARRVRPETPDALAVPDDWSEGDVELL